jgi:hypothetical protein
LLAPGVNDSGTPKRYDRERLMNNALFFGPYPLAQ